MSTLSSGFELLCPENCQVGLGEEAAQAMEPAILSLVAHAHDNFRLLLIGDHRQLGPVVNCKKLWDQLGVSLFERLFRRPGQMSLTFPIQYRMHPAICRWPSKTFFRK